MRRTSAHAIMAAGRGSICRTEFRCAELTISPLTAEMTPLNRRDIAGRGPRHPMPGKAALRHDGNVAVIAVDNPPVNALSHDVRAALVDAFSRARDDAKVEAIVLTADGRTFVAGADITEFDKPPMAPGLSDVIALIDAIDKPVVAAVFGTPLGGGLEITLACHFRVAADRHAARTAGNQARAHSRRRRHAAAAASGRHGKSRRDDLVRRSDPGEGRAGGRTGRRDFRGRSGRGRHCFRAQGARRRSGRSPARATARTSSPRCAPIRTTFDEIVAAHTKRAAASMRRWPRSRCCAPRSTCRSTTR